MDSAIHILIILLFERFCIGIILWLFTVGRYISNHSISLVIRELFSVYIVFIYMLHRMNTFFLSEMPLYITKNRDYLSFTEGM